MEGKYNTLQEEAQYKTKKMKKLFVMLMQAKSEVRTQKMTMMFWVISNVNRLLLVV